MGLEVQIRDLAISKFLEADEVFISRSGGRLMSIVKVNKTFFSNKKM
jgi:hypothetical protein